MRRKYLGSAEPFCVDCGETDVACLELEHPVGQKRDPQFTEVVCRNCHRKREMKRDLAGVTTNGQHHQESPREDLHNYLMQLAEHLDHTANSLRRKAAPLKDGNEH